ncbi:hypothetical protein [Buchananella hordeovulneris]|nr:hypothetical protein [Buchananella hordeovulneris]MDO5081281.1 hypothetical protein [Buchananella hordeovulneris]
MLNKPGPVGQAPDLRPAIEQLEFLDVAAHPAALTEIEEQLRAALQGGTA